MYTHDIYVLDIVNLLVNLTRRDNLNPSSLKFVVSKLETQTEFYFDEKKKRYKETDKK